MALDTDIYGYREAIAPSLMVSTALHAGLLALLIFAPAVFSHNGENWGNNGNGGTEGEAISAHLVSGIPLPANPQAKPENVLATDSKGLSQSIPTPAAKEDEQAIAIPDQNSKVKPPKQKASQQTSTAVPPRTIPQKPMPVTTPTRQQPREMAKADNTVPFGEGGPVSGPFTTFQNGNTAGGLKFGEGGTGSFGSRFGWYTDVVARKVHQAWQSEVNPSVVSAKRVYILFDIAKSGSPSNVRIEQSSGIPSLDQSAVRALQRIDTFGPLPQGYNGSYVSVEFWFDYRR
jgi:periplasmic protein TonB